MVLRRLAPQFLLGILLLQLHYSAAQLSQSEIQAIRRSRALSRQSAEPSGLKPVRADRARARHQESRSPDVFVPKAQAFIRSSAPLRPESPRRPAAKHLAPQPPAVAAQPSPAELQAEERSEEQREKDAILDKAEDEFIEHEQPRAIHDCGIYGNDCNYKGVGDASDVGNYMKAKPLSLKARFQSLAQSWLPNCAEVDCGKELNSGQRMVRRARAPQVLGRSVGASAAAELRYDHKTDKRWGAKGLSSKQVELSNHDIKELAKELYKEATDPDRMRAEAKRLNREVSIRQSAAHGPSAPKVPTVSKIRHLIPANQPLAPPQPRVAAMKVHTKLRPIPNTVYQGSFAPAREVAKAGAIAPQTLPAQSLEDGEEAPTPAAEDSGAEDSEGAEGAEGNEDAETGACCDWEGNCHKCPGPDEEYNFLDNLYIFPGDENGVGRSILHICMVLILLLIVVLIIQYFIERQKAESGEDPMANFNETLQSWGQNIVEGLETVWNSIKDCLGLGSKDPETKPLTQTRVV